MARGDDKSSTIDDKTSTAESDTRGRNFLGVLHRQLESAKQRAEVETGKKSSSNNRSKTYTPSRVYKRLDIARDEVNEPIDVDGPEKKRRRLQAMPRARDNARWYNYIDGDSRPCPTPSPFTQADLVRQVIMEHPEIYGPPEWLNDPNDHRPNPYLIE